MKCPNAKRIDKQTIQCKIDKSVCSLCRWCARYGGVVQVDNARFCSKTNNEKGGYIMKIDEDVKLDSKKKENIPSDNKKKKKFKKAIIVIISKRKRGYNVIVDGFGIKLPLSIGDYNVGDSVSIKYRSLGKHDFEFEVL